MKRHKTLEDISLKILSLTQKIAPTWKWIRAILSILINLFIAASPMISFRLITSIENELLIIPEQLTYHISEAEYFAFTINVYLLCIFNSGLVEIETLNLTDSAKIVTKKAMWFLIVTSIIALIFDFCIYVIYGMKPHDENINDKPLSKGIIFFLFLSLIIYLTQSVFKLLAIKASSNRKQA